MQLPYQDLTVADTSDGGRSVTALTASLDQQGRLACRFTPRDSANGYQLLRMVVQGPAQSIASVYVGEPDTLTLADRTPLGQADVADWSQPIYVPPALDLWVIWTDPNGNNYAGGPASARIETEDL